MPPRLELSTPFLNEYVRSLGAQTARNDPNKLQFLSWDYYKHIDFGPQEDVIDKSAALSGKENTIDSVLEYALVSYFSPTLLNIRPAKATEMLPANSKTSAFQLTYATLKELAELKFLDPQNTAAAGRYEGMVKFIQDKHGLTRTEIDNHYRNAVYAEISKIVDEEFSKVSFMIDGTLTTSGSYGAALTINTQNQYILSYEGYFNKTLQTKTLPPASLETLPSAMSNSRDFSPIAINTIRTQAALIPAVAYAELKKQGQADALELIIESLINFHVYPSQDNYNTLVGISARTLNNALNGNVAYHANMAFHQVLKEVNRELDTRINKQVTEGLGRNLPTLSRYPADPKFNVFFYSGK